MALGTTSLQSHPCFLASRPRPGWRERWVLSSLGFWSASQRGISLGLREPGLKEVLAPDGGFSVLLPPLPLSPAPFFAVDSACLPAFLHPHKSTLKVSQKDTSRF